MTEARREERQAFWNELNNALNGSRISAKSPKPGCADIRYEGIQSCIKVEGNLSSKGEHPCLSKIWIKFTDNDINLRNQRANDLLSVLRNDGFSVAIDSREAQGFAKIIILDTHSTVNTNHNEDAVTTADLLRRIESYLA